MLKIGITFDSREDYQIDAKSEVFADFCAPDEVEYLRLGLMECGYQVELIGNMHRLNQSILGGTFDCDLVFVEDEGLLSRNREAIVPTLLEINNIPYVGSDAYAMGLSQNKFHTKLIAEYMGIRTPKCVYVPYGQENVKTFLQNALESEKLQFPLVVKPNHEGYSMGVFLVHDMDEALEMLAWNMEHYRQPNLCEEYIKGKEVYVPVIGTGENAYAMGTGLCKHGDGSHIDIFTLKHKCFLPILDEAADFGEPLESELINASLALYRHFECRDFGRVDFKVDENQIPFFLEINPRPGLTRNGPYETLGRKLGKTYAGVLGEIVQSAIQSRRLKK